MVVKFKIKFLYWIIGLCILLTVLTFVPITPGGTFIYPNLGTTDDAFLEFQNGKVSVLIISKRTSGIQVDDGGSYSKNSGGWIYTTRSQIVPFKTFCFWVEFSFPGKEKEIIYRWFPVR